MLGGGRLIFLWTDAYTSMWSEIPSSIVVVFFFLNQVTLVTYYQANQSRRITSYPGWLVVDYHVVELRQKIV